MPHSHATMTDVSDRSRIAKGMPQGGQFAKENHGACDDSDLEPMPADTDDGNTRMETWAHVTNIRMLKDADTTDKWTMRGIRANENLDLDPDELHGFAVKAYRPIRRKDPNLAIAVAKHPNTSWETLNMMSKWNDPRVQYAVLNHPNATDVTRLLVASRATEAGVRQWAWRTMRDPANLMKADVTDRHALIGACMNPHIDERAAVRLARDGGDVAVEYLRDNETLDPVFRDMLARSDED